MWRLKNLDFESSDKEVKSFIQKDSLVLQPEEASEYALMELKIGMYNYSACEKILSFSHYKCVHVTNTCCQHATSVENQFLTPG